ncbi:hypothetical protein BaRGS_00001528 [Batillaria attramentaria]|uniref:Calx-beta domain-containing protein n=1 Tax=Batillaria attramentaria TaxID=370345 RepID=A0ABD0M751_9CAEN
MSTCDLDTYECSDKGLLMPFVNEYTWDKGFRAALYGVGLLYSFLGISIIADVFMRSIEMITSKTSPVRIADPTSNTGYREVQVKVWNDTVANLTLMALGSSAPEILLSVIEVVGNEFKAGDLGPGTIVGSAAFNLLVITAVCLISIPAGETRGIKSIKVFVVTSLFCVFAYVWLIIVLVVITPDYVDLWEAIVTFLFFPALVIIAYIFDKDYCSKKAELTEEEAATEFGLDGKSTLTGHDAVSKEVIADILRKIGKHPDVTEEDEAKIAAALLANEVSHDRMWYRINAVRGISGGHRLTPAVNEKQREIVDAIKTGMEVGSVVSLDSLGDHGLNAIVEVETIDGTAEAESDYIPFKETIVFEPGETSKPVEIKIVDDNEWEPDEVFFVRLTANPDQHCVIGKRSISQVTILNDDSPGKFSFAEPSVIVKESAGVCHVPVTRTDGADGRVVLQWEANNQTAVFGKDYDKNKGELVFNHGELTKNIEIGIIDDQAFEKDEHFEVVLTGCTPGAKIGHLNRTIVTILNDDEFRGLVSRVVNLTNTNLDMLQLHTATWGQQFKEAMNVNGGDVDSATNMDYVMHFLTFGFKVIFALVPPPSIWGGWFSFIVSLAMIGLLTALVGDLAGIFGCLIGLKDSVTAITLVALGTSLPDLFASRSAAVNEKYADNAVGNVTGSNSVNGTTFNVPAGTLSFSVTLYVISAVLAICLLLARRYLGIFGKAELGGPTGTKWMSAIFLGTLWLFYVVLSSLQAYGHITVDM